MYNKCLVAEYLVSEIFNQRNKKNLNIYNPTFKLNSLFIDSYYIKLI